MKRLIESSEGFTLIAVMVIVVIMGIMLDVSTRSWQTIMKREREEELLFRGQQIRDAITRWNKPRGSNPNIPNPPPRPLNELKDLLQDPNTAETVRYLRRLYTDPITGKDFDVIRDPVRGIVGVKSTSQEHPLKQGNFPDELKSFANKEKYSDWTFDYRLKATSGPTAGNVSGLPGQPPVQ